MGFSSFRINVIVRLTLFSGLMVVAVWGFVDTDWEVTPFVSTVLAAIVLLELIRYVESVNREMRTFLDFVAHHDFSLSFPIGRKGRVFRELEDAYRVLVGQYRELNQARELNHQYLESLVEHVSVAVLCLDDEDRVTLMNRQAKVLFRTPHLPSLQAFRRIDPSLPSKLGSLNDGDRTLIQLRIENEPLQLVLFATRFKLLDREYRLISFQNIRDQLEQREIDFSQKLIKVLTHEIMNSVTPIIALCKVIEDELLTIADQRSDGDSGSTDRSDLLRSVASIQSRGDGLLRFVKAYGSLTSLPRPNLTSIEVATLLRQIETLLAPTVKAAGIRLETRLADAALSLYADPEQLQQVLINLVNNAAEALNGRPNGLIVLSGNLDDDGKPVIQVSDNGPGIEQEALDQIFVPFFTTKKNGTGVGLSVSRQIMFLNRGLISVRTTPGQGSEFTLAFR
jgi:nitrogen fixation/metabolism regulation signal transduction histidine kinase